MRQSNKKLAKSSANSSKSFKTNVFQVRTSSLEFSWWTEYACISVPRIYAEGRRIRFLEGRSTEWFAGMSNERQKSFSITGAWRKKLNVDEIYDLHAFLSVMKIPPSTHYVLNGDVYSSCTYFQGNWKWERIKEKKEMQFLFLFLFKWFAKVSSERQKVI